MAFSSSLSTLGVFMGQSKLPNKLDAVCNLKEIGSLGYPLFDLINMMQFEKE